jgi:hypothetical protein
VPAGERQAQKGAEIMKRTQLKKSRRTSRNPKFEAPDMRTPSGRLLRF